MLLLGLLLNKGNLHHNKESNDYLFGCILKLILLDILIPPFPINCSFRGITLLQTKNYCTYKNQTYPQQLIFYK